MEKIQLQRRKEKREDGKEEREWTGKVKGKWKERKGERTIGKETGNTETIQQCELQEYRKEAD